MDMRIYDEFANGILEVMPEQVVKIILYGSVASQSNDKGSDIDYDHFLKWLKILPFYMNIEKEGITLWKAA